MVFRQHSKTQSKSTELEMKSRTMPKPDKQPEAPSLDRCYGKIGISAVAAALPYQSDAKNLAYAPVAHRLDAEWLAEKAA